MLEYIVKNDNVELFLWLWKDEKKFSFKIIFLYIIIYLWKCIFLSMYVVRNKLGYLY